MQLEIQRKELSSQQLELEAKASLLEVGLKLTLPYANGS